MKPRGLSICYYPSTVVFVDDDPTLLKAVAQEVQTYAPCATFTRVEDAIQFIRTHGRRNFGKRAFQDEDGFNEHRIHEEIYNAKRFSDIALLVIDYQMPKKNGLQLSEEVSDFNIPTIMLTGEADETLAVEAFNEGLIDAYIKKSTENLTPTLVTRIAELQLRHFLDVSLSMTSILSDRRTNTLSSCFHDRGFVTFFKAFLSEHGLTEYYLFNCPGDFLVLDRHGKPSWFIVKERKELDAAIQKLFDTHSKDFKTPQQQALRLELEEHKRMPFFFSPKTLDQSVSDWIPYLHPCEVLDSGEEGKVFYYALIPYESQHGVLNLSKIQSCEQYLEQNEKENHGR